MIFITRFMNSFLHQASFATGYWYYDRHRSVRLVILVGLAIDQIAQSGLSSLSVIYYSAQLFSILFMDEATSHLDLKNESIINQSISGLSITRVIVAHRPSTIASADRVIDLSRSCNLTLA